MESYHVLSRHLKYHKSAKFHVNNNRFLNFRVEKSSQIVSRGQTAIFYRAFIAFSISARKKRVWTSLQAKLMFDTSEGVNIVG